MALCYSINEEDFGLTGIGEVIDALDGEGRLEVGAVYWEADCRRMQAGDVFSVDQILENMGDQLYEDVGEVADDYPAASDEAKAELRALLIAWVEKHANPDQYWVVVGKPREKRVTADDMPPNAELSRAL